MILALIIVGASLFAAAAIVVLAFCAAAGKPTPPIGEREKGRMP